ncbi:MULTISPECIES: hypothetical protein [unclassified Bradyrhizobium]|uniref:hypothetical protein n=1 Tax=unclassified Bradyrhizobium TaxID=2631580 RepID=UPI0033988BF8
MKITSAEYETLLTALHAALGPDRRPLLVGIMAEAAQVRLLYLVGRRGNLNPAIHLDLFLKQNEFPAPMNAVLLI